MNKVFAIIIGILIIGGIGWVVIPNRNVPEKSGSQTELKRAPGFALQDYNGKTIRLEEFAGKPLVINSWAAWCPFCRKELPDFAAAQKEFRDKITIIAIDRAEAKETVKMYSDKLGITDDLIFLLDPTDSFYQSLGGFSMPETIFVNSEGSVVFHKRGPMDITEIREKIKEISN